MIIGLTGKAGTGKDSAADYLVERHGFTKLSFATPLKAGLNAMFGFTEEQWLDREWKETVLPEFGLSPRQLAQTLGTDWGRMLVKQDLWPTLAMAQAADKAKVVFADVRFDNEAEAIREAGGHVFQMQRLGVAPVAAHSSETPISAELVTDYVINNQTINHMHVNLAELMNLHVGDSSWQA